MFSYKCVFIKGVSYIFTEKNYKPSSKKYDDSFLVVNGIGDVEENITLSEAYNIINKNLPKVKDKKKDIAIKVIDSRENGKSRYLCKICGRTFRTSNVMDNYCSKKCADEDPARVRASKFVENSVKFTCKVCNVVRYIHPEVLKDRTTCGSTLCVEVAHSGDFDLTIYKRNCEVCGLTFITKSCNNITCSSVCRISLKEKPKEMSTLW